MSWTFGKNWNLFIGDYLSDENVQLAKDSLRSYYEVDDFDGKRFIDVGCGSGLYSLAAHRLGADEVFSFDYDENSVRSCRELYEQEGCPDNWTVTQGDVLDRSYVESLGTFDIVYSWGVLHHTGAVFEAIDNALLLIEPGGMGYIAVVKRRGKSDTQIKCEKVIKRAYRRSPQVLKFGFEAVYAAKNLAGQTLSGNNPIAYVRRYPQQNRGMEFYPDLRDALGSIPVEYTTKPELIEFFDQYDGYTLEKTTGPAEEKHEFLIRRT